MNLQQFEYVIAVKELGNFSEAAEKCNIGQSTLSTMIGKLEDELGILFFDRSTKPVRVTKEGLELIKQMKIISQEVSLLKEMVFSQKGELRGNIHLGIIPTIAPYVLPNFFSQFTHNYPLLNVSVSEMTTQNIANAIKNRDLDMGLLALPLNDPDLREMPIYNEGFVLYDCTGIERKRHVDASIIDPEHFWLMEEGHCLSHQVIQICNIDLKKGRKNFHFRAGSIDSLIRFVRQNKGMTLLPELSVIDMKLTEEEKIYHFKSPIPVRSVGLVYHKHFVKKAVLENVINVVLLDILPKLKESAEFALVNPV